MPEGPPADASPAAPGAPPRRYRAGLAWAAILLLLGLVVALHALPGPSGAGSGAFADRMLERQVRFQYGVRELVRSLPGPASPIEVIDVGILRESLGKGPAATRHRIAAVAGDLAGPSAAREDLDRLETLLRERGRVLEGEDAAVHGALRALYEGGGERHDADAAAALPQDRREVLVRRLGWFGRLALAPEGSPDRAAVLAGTGREALLLLGAVGAGLLVLGIGFVGALLYWVRASSGRAVFRLAPSGTPHGVYAETFAVWLASFVLLMVVGGRVAEAATSPAARIALIAATQVLSLGALAWPVLRGVPFRRVREDLGLRFPATPVRDALAGIGCWVLGLPVIAGAAVVSFAAATVVLGLRGKGDPLESPVSPGHPIVEEIAGGFPWAGVFLVACVLAPLVEETFFRGVLYRHLRDATAARGRAVSVLLSAAISGFVFAAVHPQGPLFIPLLAAVAWPLVHAREWRDSLVAPMVAHGFHNALVTTFAWLMLG